MVRRLVFACALSGALYCTSLAGAQTVVPWPAAGAPLCTAPGDQFSLSPLGGGVTWFSHSGPADSLHLGGAGDHPPTGGCLSESAVITAGVVPGSIGSSQFETGICLGCPGCGCTVDLAKAWVSRDAISDRIVMHVRHGGLVQWTQADIVVREAGLGQLASPSLAASGTNLPDSSAIVVWAEGIGPSSQVRAQRVGPDGTPLWNGPDGIVLSTAGANPSILSLAQTNGSVLVVWEDHTGASSDIRAVRLLPDGTPAPGWPAAGILLEGRSEASANPRLVGGYEFLVAWEESGARFGGGTSIVARKLLASGLPDPAWPDSGVVVTSSPTVDHLEDVTTGLTFLWSDVRSAGPGNPNDLFAQSLKLAGTLATGWPADGVAWSTAPGSQDHARSSGGLYAWEDTRSGEAKVYVTDLDASGQRPCCNWLADGNPAALAAGAQQRPVVDGHFVYWEDGRDLATNGLDIYVQAFLNDGTNGTLGIEDGPLPARVAWREPFPNPARATTRLHLDLPRDAHVRVSVHDLLGRRVRTLNDGLLAAGPHEWDWRGTDDAGSRVPVGIYQVRAIVDGVASTRSVVWIR